MDDFSTYAPSQVRARSDVAALLGQVMFLVAVALGFMTAGALIGQDLSQGTGFLLFLVAFGMLIGQSFVERLRVGTLGICWLYAIALLLGLGIGPTIGYFLDTNQGDVVMQSAGCTALITLGMGAGGFAMSKDLAAWMRPLTFLILGLVVVSFVMLIFSSGGNPFISAAIAIVSALLIMVDFNYLRKHGTKDDAIWLATGIFVSIVNIFLSLLNILDS
jgi:modulator of FtsH protease